MKKETFQYNLPADTSQGEVRLRHIMDFETYYGVIHRIQNKNKGSIKNG